METTTTTVKSFGTTTTIGAGELEDLIWATFIEQGFAPGAEDVQEIIEDARTNETVFTLSDGIRGQFRKFESVVVGRLSIDHTISHTKVS